MPHKTVGLLLASLIVWVLAVPALAQNGTPATPEELAQGEKVYNAHCRSCHLPGGKSRIKKLNLSDTEWMHGGSLEEIQKNVTEGIEGSQMQPFKNKLKPEEIDAVAKYVFNLSASPGPGS